MAVVYATNQEIADYMGIAVGSLPSNIEVLKARAMELIDYMTLNKVPDYYLDSDDNITDTDIDAALAKAMGATIEYWVNTDPSQDIIGQVQSFQIGKFSMTFADGKMPVLSPRAQRALMLVGLMYRGVCRM